MFWAQISAKGAKIVPKARFFVIFSSLVQYFSLKLHSVIACNNVQHVGDIKFKTFGSKFGPKGPNQFQNQVFCHFLKFGSLVFLEIVYNDSLHQFLTCKRVKIYEKKFRPKFGPKWPKSVLKLVFFTIFSSLVSLFFLEIAYNDSLQQCLICSSGKIKEKKLGSPNLGPILGFFAIFLSLVYQFSLKLDTMVACNNV